MKNRWVLALILSICLFAGSTAAADFASLSPINNHFCSVTNFGATPGDTIDDSSAIQAAVDSCRNVYFPAGDYRIEEKIVIARDNVALFGDPRGVQLNKTAVGRGPVFEISDRENIRINRLTFVGPGLATLKDSPMSEAIAVHVLYSRNVTIERCSFTGFNGSGVLRVTGDSAYAEPTRWSEGIIIRNNRFYDNLDRIPERGDVAANAIYLLAGVRDFIIEGNWVDAPLQKVGIAAHSNIRDGKIIGNRVEDNGRASGSAHAYGIMVYAFPEALSQNVDVEGNMVLRSAHMGIYIKGENSFNINVRNNFLQDCDEFSNDVTLPAGSIATNEVTGMEITGNWISGVSTIGIQIFKTGEANALVADNFIEGCAEDTHGPDTGGQLEASRGITLRSGANPLSHVNIRDNYIRNIEMGITWWTPFAGGLLSQINIVGNDIIHTKQAIAGLDLTTQRGYADGLNIAGNRIDTADIALRATNLQNTIIEKNRFTECATTLYLANPVNVTERGNRTIQSNQAGGSFTPTDPAGVDSISKF